MAAYVYGNTVRREVQPIPKRTEPKRTADRQVNKNRDKALHISAGYVTFLVVAAVVALFVCVKYLQLQSEVATRSDNIVAMQQELIDLKEENTAKQDSILNAVNLEEVKDKAMNELGMVYATSEQIIHYQNPVGNQVTQHSVIPKNGILASTVD